MGEDNTSLRISDLEHLDSGFTLKWFPQSLNAYYWLAFKVLSHKLGNLKVTVTL